MSSRRLLQAQQQERGTGGDGTYREYGARRRQPVIVQLSVGDVAAVGHAAAGAAVVGAAIALEDRNVAERGGCNMESTDDKQCSLTCRLRSCPRAACPSEARQADRTSCWRTCKCSCCVRVGGGRGDTRQYTA